MEFTETQLGQSKDVPAKMVIYGVPKIGKSRFAAQAPDVFFINIEGGLQYLPSKVRATPKLSTYDEVMAWLKHIYESDFKAGCIAIDSFDWLEGLAQAKLIKMYNATSITDSSVKEFAYHKGVMEAATMAKAALRWLDAIYKKKGIPAIIIAHSEVKTVSLPTHDDFQRYQMKLSKSAAERLCEWADLVLFADFAFYVTKDGKKSEPKRMLRAGGSADYIGGGRMRISKDLPLDYNELVKEITK